MLNLLNAQQITSYKLDVTIDMPSKNITVEGLLTVDFEGEAQIETVLWKHSEIAYITHHEQPVAYTFDTNQPSPITFIDDGSDFIISNPSKKDGPIDIKIKYSSDFTQMQSGAESFHEDWLQIGFYNAWYPVDLNSSKATSKLNIFIDPAYSVSGSGRIIKQKDHWVMVQDWPSFDQVIIASKHLQTTRATSDNAIVVTVFSDIPKETVQNIVNTAQNALDYFVVPYPNHFNHFIKFVLKQSEQDGGYNRKNFISLRLKNFTLHTQKTIAHEIAHFWATGADTNTWEDWLNEAFAEYSALLFIRDKVDSSAFDNYLKTYTEGSKNTPAIWGLERSHKDAHKVLYYKGALALHALHQRIGDDKFNILLAFKSQMEPMTTNSFLELLENQTNLATRTWFETLLKQ